MATSNEWRAPDNPDPNEIMNSGVLDAMAGRHAVALAKFLWFHHNALLIDRALFGVRLSFALGYWHQLAEDYPPAMTALLEAREQAESSYLNEGHQFSHFSDLAALNRELDEPQRTVAIFKRVLQENSEAATLVYHIAEPALVNQKEFDLCNPFLQPTKRVEVALRGFRVARRFETGTDHSDEQPPETAYKHLCQNLATLVALLVLNNRASEAEAVASEAQAALPDYPLMPQLESALAGDLPPQWP